MNQTQLPWRSRFEREVAIRKAVMLYGNIDDVFPTPQGCVTLPQLLKLWLPELGYQQVLHWDQAQGLQASDPQAFAQLQANHALQAAPAGQALSHQALSHQAYDMGEYALSTPPAANNARQTMNAEDFLHLIAQQFSQGQAGNASAFIVDYSHLMFSGNRSLPDNERQHLVRLGQALRDAPIAQQLYQVQQSQPAPLIIFLCRDPGDLPSSLVLNNPVFGQVPLTRPNRQQREQFLSQYLELFRLEPMLLPQDRKFIDFVDAQEGFSYRDCLQLAQLSRAKPFQQHLLSADKLVNLYKYGEQHSPWESLNRDKLKHCAEKLAERVKGQAQAIDKVDQMLIKAYSGLSGVLHSSSQSKPKGILFFVGPTGVGKTELAKALANFLFGDDQACLRFDMSEFNHEHADQRLVGAPPGYVGHEQGGQLTNAVKAKPFSVILFDEIEKAHGKILDKFLQILEDGRLTDGKGETVSFAETVIIFTSNIGAAQVSAELPAEAVAAAFKQQVQQHFTEQLGRPELLGRIGDNIVPFNFIADPEFQLSIARGKLMPLVEKLKQKYQLQGIQFIDERKALMTLCAQSDIRWGGRDIVNALDQYLITALAQFIVQYEPCQLAQRSIQVLQVGDQCQFVFQLQ